MKPNLKSMPRSLTAKIKKSITGNGLIGYLKEYPSAVSQGKNEKELVENLIDAMLSLNDATTKFNDALNPFFDDRDTFEKEICLSAR